MDRSEKEWGARGTWTSDLPAKEQADLQTVYTIQETRKEVFVCLAC